MLLILLTSSAPTPGGEGDPYYLEDVAATAYELEDGSGFYVQE